VPAGEQDVPRILGLVEGEPSEALSGVAQFVFDAVGKRFPVVTQLDYAPHGAERLALALATFRPRSASWRGRFHTSRLSHRVLSRVLARRLAGVEEDFDVALQVHGWAAGQPRPYALFVDQTRLMAERGWPAWLPLTRLERSRVLTLERDMYRAAFHVFAMGRPAQSSLIDDYALDPADISVVGGGVCFDPLPSPSGPTGDPTILFVGKDFERKGGEDLTAAFAIVRAQLPNAVLHVVGASRRLRAPGVVIHGKLSDRRRVAQLYERARVLCLPARYEPFGLVLLEAMAHAVPCVGTTVQSIPDILDQGRAGVVVPPREPRALADALITLLTDDALARSIGLAGRKRLEQHFTWDLVAERMAPALAEAGRAGHPQASLESPR